MLDKIISYKNTKDLFFLIDLDGTLIDSDYYHYIGYKNVFKIYNVEFSYNLFIEIINGSGMDIFIEKILGKNEIQNIKQKKMNILQLLIKLIL